MKRITTLAFVAAVAMLAIPASAPSFCLDNGGKAIYGPRGSYQFTGGPAGNWRGRWSGNPSVGGGVTVTFSNGYVRHDRFVDMSGGLVLIDKDGRGWSGHFC